VKSLFSCIHATLINEQIKSDGSAVRQLPTDCYTDTGNPVCLTRQSG